MASHPTSAGEGRKVTLPIVIISLIVLLLVMGWLYKANFAEDKGVDVPISAAAASNDKRMEEVFKKSHGDLNQVGPEDRDWLHQYTHGREQEAFNYLNGRAKKPGQ